jgi:osmotically-inducible protein OsmY
MGTSLSWCTDTQLYDAVRLQLDEDPAIRAHDIAVIASDGVVTLTGFVDSYAEKITAEEAVKRVRGVRAVANDIDVKLRDERADPEIAKDAIKALESHASVPDRVTVTVRHGFVTLDGAVEWMYQKDAAESAVKYLKGVRGVSNRLRIRHTPTSVDIRARIEQALERSAAIDAAGVRVETIDGIVTLSGEVRSWAERQDAERAAWSLPGVMQVENELIVAS